MVKTLSLIFSLYSANTFANSGYPWAEVAQSVQSTIARGEDADSVLRRIAPEYTLRLLHESRYDWFKHLWGQSINYDELAKNQILAPELVDALSRLFRVQARRGLVVHAGLEHTYGYLLSTLHTKFGFKRDRWVNPDIEHGFGLAQGDLSPFPKNGGLFSNVTYFAGAIAFRNEADAIRLLGNPTQNQGVSPTMKNFDFRRLRVSRLTETILLQTGRRVEIRTDFVPFLRKNHSSQNDGIMIYSVKDSSRPLPYLVTAFPITLSTMLPSQSSLGGNQSITTRWNAFIPGITNSQTPLIGTRTFK